MGFSLRVPWLTYLPFKMGDAGFSNRPSRKDDVGRVEYSHRSVRSTTTDSDGPLPLLILPHLLYESRGPDV